MDKVNRRRFFGMFGAGAAVAAPAAVAATTRFKADLQDATTREVFNESTKAYLMGGGTIPAEDALRVAFLRESEALMDGGHWRGTTRMEEIKTGLDVLEQLDRLGIRPLRRT